MTVVSDPWDGPHAVPDLTPAHQRSWQPVDLSDVLSGSWEPPAASVGRRADGVGLFYPGKVHTVSSESEAGKTWLALSACLDVITDGGHVLYLDFEDDEGSIVRRLLALQLGADQIRDRFHYVRPTEALGGGINADDLREILTGYRPALCVIDGITEAMTLHGMDPLSNRDIAAFGRLVPRSIADAGPAVVCLDHVVKSSENRGKYALGGVHKLNGLDGAALVMENVKPFGVGLEGLSRVRIAKDRPGQLRKHALTGKESLMWFADLKLNSHAEGFLEVEVVAPTARSEEDFRPSMVMAKISKALEEHGPMPQREILSTVKGRREIARDALALMQRDGYVSRETPHRLLKPFTDGGEA